MFFPAVNCAAKQFSLCMAVMIYLYSDVFLYKI